jgi:hypothetical protein
LYPSPLPAQLTFHIIFTLIMFLLLPILLRTLFPPVNLLLTITVVWNLIPLVVL